MLDPSQVVGGSLAIFGALLAVLGAVGVLRFPDVYTRIHAASITDTAGASVMILGLAIISGFTMVTLKLAIVWACLMLTSPAAAHALANAAFSSGHSPWIGSFRIMKDGEGKSKSMPPTP
jgi:multicomponent Na+:H+ antiporter subunit G